MNLYKLAAAVALTAGFAQTVHSAELGSNISLDTEVKTTYKVDAETGNLLRIFLSPMILTPFLLIILSTSVKDVLPPWIAAKS